MTRRRKKEDKRLYTKEGEPRERVIARQRTQADGREKLKGVPVKKPWMRKGNGPIVDIELTPPPILRRDVRENQFGDGSRRVRSVEEGRRPYTKPAIGRVRKRNRRRNAIAKISRRINR